MQNPPAKDGEKRPMSEHCDVWVNEVDDGYVIVAENRDKIEYTSMFDFAESENLDMVLAANVIKSSDMRCECPLQPNSCVNICHLQVADLDAESFELKYKVKCTATETIKKKKPDYPHRKMKYEPKKEGERRKMDGMCDIWINETDNGYVLVGENRDPSLPYDTRFDFGKSENLKLYVNERAGVKEYEEMKVQVELKPKSVTNICHLEGLTDVEFFDLQYKVDCKKRVPQKINPLPLKPKLGGEKRVMDDTCDIWINETEDGYVLVIQNRDPELPYKVDFDFGNSENLILHNNEPEGVESTGHMKNGFTVPPNKTINICHLEGVPDCEFFDMDYKVKCTKMSKKKVKPPTPPKPRTPTPPKPRTPTPPKPRTPTPPPRKARARTPTPPPKDKAVSALRLEWVPFTFDGVGDGSDSDDDGDDEYPDFVFFNKDHGKWIKKPMIYVFEKKELMKFLNGRKEADIKVSTQGVPSKSKKGFVTGNDNFGVTGHYVRAVIDSSNY